MSLSINLTVLAIAMRSCQVLPILEMRMEAAIQRKRGGGGKEKKEEGERERKGERGGALKVFLFFFSILSRQVFC